MVSKITLFEPHFDGAQFGPKTIDGAFDRASEESATEAQATDSSPRRFPTRRVALGVVPLFVALIGGAVALRRFRARGAGGESEAATSETPTIERRTGADLAD